MALLSSLQSDILGSTALSDVLRKATVLAYRLKSQEFKDWVRFELEGYYGKDVPELPDYRIVQATSMGYFASRFAEIKNATIDLSIFGDRDIRGMIERLEMRQGARELESLLEAAARSEAGWFKSRGRHE